MEYFQSNKLLISHQPSSEYYRVRNNIGLKVSSYLHEEFSKLPNKKSLSKSQFYDELNNYFRNHKESWEVDGVRYRAMENFEVDGSGHISNYTYSKIPKRSVYVPGETKAIEAIYVYNKSRVYLMDMGSIIKGLAQLVDDSTHSRLSYIKISNCCPIMDLDLKLIK